MREDIADRQNRERSLDRLAAQRLLYRQVKRVENWRLVSVLLVAVLLLSGLAVEATLFSQWATIAVVVMWFVDQVVLVRCAGMMKEEAATMQEDFDCFVLEMPWPEQLGAARPTEDRVRELALRADEGSAARDELVDWYYAQDIPTEAVAARLHCQRINCYWDSRLRREWIWSVRIAMCVIVIVGLAVGTIVEISLFEVVLGAAAGIRLLAWLLLEQRAQSVARERIEELHRFLSGAQVERHDITLCDVRLVQAAIFEHRRMCPTVPDWFYEIRKNAYEQELPG